MSSEKFLEKFENDMDGLYSSDNQFAKYQEYLHLMNNCSLCGSSLELEHTVELEGSMIREEARCPHCEVRTRNKIYNIQ
jgi:DNA-directed RNA polymerase subunit RPC12/RpoP